MSLRKDGNPYICSNDECTLEHACAECQAAYEREADEGPLIENEYPRNNNKGPFASF